MGNIAMLSDNELISQVRHASSLAYAPYSKFKVGSILEATNGQIFVGCNVENASYGLAICAERTAVVKAISSEVKSFSRVTVFA
jgi:cytidine deaminase